MLSFNVDFVVECVKNISDNTQCLTCGKLTGPCVRFPCGHSVCKGCAEEAGECVSCVCSSNPTYMLDKPQSNRLYNTSKLLTTFEDTFKVDVYKKQRISDQLKLEKQLFPGCIQAPYRYFNKTKSLNKENLRKNKENIDTGIFLGEPNIYSDKDKMKKSYQYVQNWLNEHKDVPQNLPRKPFGDINVNTQSFTHKGKKNVTKLNKTHTDIKSKISTCRKKSYFKAKNHSPSLLENYMKPDLKNNNINKQVTATEVEISEECLKTRKSDRNESGIVIDDEPIVVDDTQIDIIDKDHQAWLAVLKEAEERENRNMQVSKCRLQTVEHSSGDINNTLSSNRLDNVHNVHEIESSIPQQVLFLKKGSLFETCKLCNKSSNSEIKYHSKTDENNDVSITINNSEFVITIQCTKQNISEMLNKSSVAIQTDKPTELTQNTIVNDSKKTITHKRKSMLIEEQIPTKIIKPDDAIQSLDIFSTDKSNEHKLQSNCDNNAIKQNINDDSVKHKNLIIDDSDTDSSITQDNIYEIVADVHRTSAPENVQQGILKTLSVTNYHQRSKQPLRGRTPNSSDSSDKENLDPNRNKQSKFGKKLKNKKSTHRRH